MLREERLDRILFRFGIKTRSCPLCGGTFPKSKSWVIIKDFKPKLDIAVCRSCYTVHKRKVDVEKVKELYPLCFTMEPRWKIDGAKLREVRKILGVASKRFAEKCGWGESYQSKLEVGSVITVSDGHRKRMDEAIEFFLRQLF